MRLPQRVYGLHRHTKHARPVYTRLLGDRVLDVRR
jgi:hypothetical protein